MREQDVDYYQILIVEDDEAYRQSLRDCLDGHQRVSANNCADGLERFKEYCPDITFLDIKLTDGSGLDLLKKMREYDPEAFIVMTTQSTLKQDVDTAMNNGAAGYVIKPFNRKKILAYVDQYRRYRQELAEKASDDRMEHLQKHLKVERRTIPPQLEEAEAPVSKKHDEYTTQLAKTLHSFRILFVDDFHKNRINARKHISKLGCHVDLAENDDDAQKLMKSNRYHLVFLSTHVGGEDPYKLVYAIREHDKEKMVQSFFVGMSNSIEEVESKRWLHAGMDQCIAKPYSFAKIEEMVLHYAREYQNEMVLSRRYAKEEGEETMPLAVQDAPFKDYLENVRSALSHVLRDPLRNARNLLSQGGDIKTVDANIVEVLDDMDLLNRYAHLCQEVPKKESVNMASVIESIASQMKKGRVLFDKSSLPTLQGNEEQLTHIFKTLIENGLIFNHHASPEVRISVAKEQHYWVVTVTDNGIGLDDVYEKLIARPFTKLSPEEYPEGKGMNLALAKVMITNHGGSLSYHSEGEEMGTAFRVKWNEGTS